MTQYHPEPDNGGDDPNPRCSWNERRIGDTYRLATETRGAVGALASSVDHLHAWSSDFEARALREFERLSSQGQATDTKVDRLLEGLAIGQVRMTQASRDWDPDEPTLHGREPEQAARVWKARAADGAQRETELEAQIAALTATLTERDRQSTRVRDDKREKLRFWGGIAVAFITSGGGVLLITKLLGG